MNRGTGYTTTFAQWEKQDSRPLASFPIDRAARPWGNDGGPYAADAIPPPDIELYYRRYAQGTRPTFNGVFGRGIGAWGEAIGMNVDALKRWYAQQSPEHRGQWDGEPTTEEVYDAAFSQPRNGAFYRRPVVDPPPPPIDDGDDDTPPPPPPPVKVLAPVEQRVNELIDIIIQTEVFAAPVPPWLRRLLSSAARTGLLDLALRELVRAKRKIHGEVPV